MQRPVLLEKAEKVNEVRDLIRKHKAMGIAGLQKVRASQLQQIRKKLGETAYLRVFKNAIVERAISKSEEDPTTEKLKGYLKGSNLLLFTDLNPFKLALLLERSKVKDFAKVGDAAVEDIVVPAGNTGLSPGPIISQLGSVRIPTRIESGSVWVNRDTVVAKKGEVVSESLAPILSKLGIKSVEMGLSLKVVYDAGTLITEDDLKLNLDEYRQNLSEAYMCAFNLALSAAYPTAENILALIRTAAVEAHYLALNGSIPSPETIADLIRKAHFEAATLATKIPQQRQEAAK